MRGVVSKRRFGLMPTFLINFLIRNWEEENKKKAYFFGFFVGCGDFIREKVLKPTYRRLPTEFKVWYDKVRYRV